MMGVPWQRYRVLLILLACCCTPHPAKALGSGFDLFVAAIGGVVHRDAVFGTDVFLAYQGSSTRVIVGAPLRFDPNGLRAEDWDEVADFGRIVAEASWTGLQGRIEARLGTVNGFTLGAGNLVSHFHSTVDPDHFRTGVTLHAHGDLIGVDAFLDSFLDPQVLGGRWFVRPFWPVSQRGFLGRLEVGCTLAGDLAAPVAWHHLVSGPVRMTDHGLPQSSTEGLMGAGVDLRWMVVHTSSVDVTPYGAWSLFDRGTGVHAGLGVDVRPTHDLRFGVLGEWKRLGDHYVSPGFDTLYMAERHAFGSKPRLAAVRELLDARDGLRLGLSMAWKDRFSWWTLVDLDRATAFSQVSAGLTLRIGRDVEVAMHAIERGLSDWDALLNPARFVFASILTWSATPRFGLFASYSRDLDIVDSGKDRGRYAPSDTALAGLRTTF